MLFYKQSCSLVHKGFDGEVALCVCPQVLFEFYAVITNPKRVTEPVSSHEALKEVEKFIQSPNIQKIYPNEDLLVNTTDLLKKYKVEGKEIFDLKLVATMLSNGIKNFYTYNLSDFTKYKEIKVLKP